MMTTRNRNFSLDGRKSNRYVCVCKAEFLLLAYEGISSKTSVELWGRPVW